MRWVLLLVAGCGIDPTTAALVGTWHNDDDDIARELEFASDAAYSLALDGAEVQTGTYAVEDGVLINVDGVADTWDDVLVWTVSTDASGQVAAGTQFGDPIFRLTESTLHLRTGAGDDRRNSVRESLHSWTAQRNLFRCAAGFRNGRLSDRKSEWSRP
jgi:hypothetical protein